MTDLLWADSLQPPLMSSVSLRCWATVMGDSSRRQTSKSLRPGNQTAVHNILKSSERISPIWIESWGIWRPSPAPKSCCSPPQTIAEHLLLGAFFCWRRPQPTGSVVPTDGCRWSARFPSRTWPPASQRLHWVVFFPWCTLVAPCVPLVQRWKQREATLTQFWCSRLLNRVLCNLLVTN